MKKKVLMLIVLVGMCFSLSGCLDAKKEEFAVDDLRITLTDEFKETDQDEGFTAYFESDDTGVAIVKETYSALEVLDLNSDTTIEEYIAVVQSAGGTDYEVHNENNINYFTYESEIDGINYYYMTAFYKGTDAFWIVKLFCEANDKEALQSKFVDYAQSVSFV